MTKVVWYQHRMLTVPQSLMDELNLTGGQDIDAPTYEKIMQRLASLAQIGLEAEKAQKGKKPS